MKQTGRKPGGIPSGACWRRATLTGIRKAAMTRPLRLPVTGRLTRLPGPTENPPNMSKPACGWPDTMVTCLEEEELSELLDQAIRYAGLLVNAGRPEGPDLLIRAKRAQEQAMEKAARRMRYARALPPSFFEF